MEMRIKYWFQFGVSDIQFKYESVYPNLYRQNSTDNINMCMGQCSTEYQTSATICKVICVRGIQL